jgi:hypothetical protein
MSDDWLAWYMYPEPDGTYFTAADLSTPEGVEGVFDYCQILLAVVSCFGWRFLFHHHGAAGLLEVNRTSGWFDESDVEQVTEDLCYHDSVIFTDERGNVATFPWLRLRNEGFTGVLPKRMWRGLAGLEEPEDQ